MTGGYLALDRLCLACTRLMPQDTAQLETVVQTGKLASAGLPVPCCSEILCIDAAMQEQGHIWHPVGMLLTIARPR